MFIFSKLFTFWFLPPGIFVVLLVAVIFLIWKDKKRFSLFLTFFTAVCIYLLSIEPVKDLILLPLEDAFPYPKRDSLNCELIVVLGGGEVYHSPAENGKASVKPQVAKRLFEAFRLWKVLKKPIVVSGGKVFKENVEPESAAMKRFLVELGVPESFIKEEKNSKNTFQNALFVKRLIGSKTVCLVTSAYHMPRGVGIFRTLGIKVVPVPTDYRVNRSSYSWSDFMPRVSNLEGSFLGLHEYIGIIYFDLFQKWRAREDSNLRPTD